MMKTTIDLKLPDEPLSVVAAVSGGADSMAMLHLLTQAKAEGRLRDLLCAHYNHGLRDTAERDECHVREMCNEWGIRFVSERGNVSGMAAQSGQSIEMAAREARYAFLSRVREENGYTHILTAHTANDNTETVLLNLIRGTGMAGLCGIPYRRDSILRPLLHVSRDEIRGYIRQHGVPYREDESNADTAYRRNALRQSVIPLLEEMNPSLNLAVMRMTAHLREDESFLQGLAERAMAQDAVWEDVRVTFPAETLLEAPYPVAYRILRSLTRKLSGKGMEVAHVRAVLALCEKGQNGKRTDLTGHYIARRKNKLLIIEPRKKQFRRRFPL